MPQADRRCLAEGVGFEPTSALRRQQFSRLPRSTTPAPLRDSVGADSTVAARFGGGGRAMPRLKNQRALRRCSRVESSAQTRLGRFFDRHPLLLRALAIVAPALGRRLPDLADRLERRRGQPGRLRDAAGDRDLRALGARHAGLVLLVAAARGAAAGHAGALGRRLRLHLRRADRGGRRRRWPAAARSPTRTPPTCSTTAGGRRWRSWRSSPAPRYLTRPDNSHAKAGNINAALPRTEGELVLMLDADHVPMPDALDAMVGYFDDERMALVQSPHDFFNHDSVQHYVGRPPRAVALLPRRLPRQGPPRRRLLVRLGGADPARGAARDRRRRHRDDRRGLPHDDPHAAPRLEEPLPRRGPGPGPRPARPRRLPAAARPLGARQPRRLHPARVPPARPRAAAAAAPLLLRQPRRLPGAADAAAAAGRRWAWCCGPASCR